MYRVPLLPAFPSLSVACSCLVLSHSLLVIATHAPLLQPWGSRSSTPRSLTTTSHFAGQAATSPEEWTFRLGCLGVLEPCLTRVFAPSPLSLSLWVGMCIHADQAEVHWGSFHFPSLPVLGKCWVFIFIPTRRLAKGHIDAGLASRWLAHRRAPAVQNPAEQR